MNRLAALLCHAALCALMAACTTLPAPLPPEPHLHDALFTAPAAPIDAAAVFALNDRMRRYLREDIGHQLRSEGLQRGLIRALQQRGQLKLDYDSAITRNAAEAFEARTGNCLSLVIMTAAFAKELGLRVTYQSVDSEESWSRSDDLVFRNGHVNLTLGPTAAKAMSGYDPNRLLTIDFLPAEEITGQRTRAIAEETIVAMYFNNRAAEALARGDVEAAYWQARTAIRTSPSFTSAYNTLAVIYLRHGNPAEAAALLAELLRREPSDTEVMTNLVVAYDELGRSAEAAALKARLARIEPDPPYAFFNRGKAAMARGDYLEARQLFAKEIARADYNSEIHFWFAIANLRLGDFEAARKHLAIALENSTTRGDHDLYAAKLDRLRSLRMP